MPVVIARFAGPAKLGVGGEVQHADTTDESLLGFVVHAETHFSVNASLPEGGVVYLNGEPIEGSGAPE